MRTAGDPHECRRINGMRPDRDYTRRFVEELCWSSADRQVPVSTVEREYKRWALENSGVPMPIRQLVSNLEDRHGVRRSSADQGILVGIAIRGNFNEQELEMSRRKRRRTTAPTAEGTYVPVFEEIEFDESLELLPGDMARPYKYYGDIDRLKGVPREWRVVIRELPARGKALDYKRALDIGKLKRPAGNFEFKAIVHPTDGDFCIVGRFMGEARRDSPTSTCSMRAARRTAAGTGGRRSARAAASSSRSTTTPRKPASTWR